MLLMHYFQKQKTEIGMVDIMDNEPFDVPTKPFGGSEDLIWGSKWKYDYISMQKVEWRLNTLQAQIPICICMIWSQRKLKTLPPKNQGYDTSPVLSKDGKTLAYLSMKRDGYESDKNNLMLYSLDTDTRVNLTATQDITVSGFDFGNEKNVIWIFFSK